MNTMYFERNGGYEYKSYNRAFSRAWYHYTPIKFFCKCRYFHIVRLLDYSVCNLIDLYMSNLINKDEFTATRASCDAEIEELQSIIESVDKQREMIEQQQQLLKEIEDAIKEIVSGVEYEDEFYKHILDKMVVQDKDNIDVYLNLLPMKWSYTVAKASKKAVASEWNISEASLPMSVSRAFSSG